MTVHRCRTPMSLCFSITDGRKGKSKIDPGIMNFDLAPPRGAAAGAAVARGAGGSRGRGAVAAAADRAGAAANLDLRRAGVGPRAGRRAGGGAAASALALDRAEARP